MIHFLLRVFDFFRQLVAKILPQRMNFRQVQGLDFDIYLKTTNTHERRHQSLHEEEYLQHYIRYCQNTRVIFDIGGHVGIFALSAAITSDHVEKVYVFEPTPWNYATLTENIEYNKQTQKIVPLQFALGEENKTETIQGLPISGWGGSSFVRSSTDDSNKKEKTVEVAIKKGDDLVRSGDCEAPSLIKIDVEGFEFFVLKGLEETLRKHHPVVFVEMHPEYLVRLNITEEEIHNFLEDIGYSRVFRQKWQGGEQYQCIYEVKS